MKTLEPIEAKKAINSIETIANPGRFISVFGVRNTERGYFAEISIDGEFKGEKRYSGAEMASLKKANDKRKGQQV